MTTRKTTVKKTGTNDTPEHWRGVIETLMRQRAEVEARLAELERTKRPLLLPARTGDDSARTQVDALNQQLAQAQMGGHGTKVVSVYGRLGVSGI